MTATLARVVLEAEAPPAVGSFIIGINHVGDALTLAGVTVEWQALTAEARTIEIVRGGARNGVVGALDTGTLTVAFVADSWAPEDSPALAPNRPIRLRTVDGDPVFTGRLQDVFTVDDKDGHSFTTVLAVDGIKSASNTNLTGATSPAGFETWAERIRRLCTFAATATNPPEV